MYFRLLIATSRNGPTWVPILAGGVGLVTAGVSRIVPPDSPAGKALSWLLTKQGQYSLSAIRLAVVVFISLALIGLGIALIATGH